MQYSGYDTKRYCCDDDSNGSSKERSDRGGHLGSNKRPKSAPRLHRSRNRGRVKEDDEYEVEQILEVRVYRGKLQYRAKWCEYNADLTWYDASNFKNSPHKLREFHSANSTRPGPPANLETWVQCWEEDRDADDDPSDNKPKRSGNRRSNINGLTVN
jgi:hypothetical protein